MVLHSLDEKKRLSYLESFRISTCTIIIEEDSSLQADPEGSSSRGQPVREVSGVQIKT